jgi:hypothetical protein
MDVNSAFLQIPSPTAASPSVGAASKSQEVNSPGKGGTKKFFASVLRTVQQSDEKGRVERSNTEESRRASKSETKPVQEKEAGDDAPRPGKIEGRGHETETNRPSRSQTDQANNKEGRSQDSDVLESSAPADLGRVSEQTVPSEGVPVAPPVLSGDDPGQGTTEDALVDVTPNNRTAEASAALGLVMATPGEFVTATTEATNHAPNLPQEATVPLVRKGQVASASQPMVETQGAASSKPLNPMAAPVVETVGQETGEQEGIHAQGRQDEKQVASVQPLSGGEKQASPVSQELSRLDAAGPQLTRSVEQPVQQKQADAGAHPHRDPHVPPPSSDSVGQERTGKSTAVASHGLQAVADSGKSQDFFGPDQEDQQLASGENPRKSHIAMGPSQSDRPVDYSAQPVAIGNAASIQPRSVDSRSTAPEGSPATVAQAHDLEPFAPAMSRSVVFEVAGSDLGRINIRVSMANELVHAHLSADRSDVGQFLVNGQDRLQSSLQSNGLDLGQFRVDIDRQSAGRSFQQGPPQDESRMWQQTSNGAPREERFVERHEAGSLAYAGRLNVVA